MKHRLPNHVKPERYQILMKPDLGAFSFSGKETIFLKITKPTQELVLHSKDLRVKNVVLRIKNHELLIKNSRIKYDKKSETVTFEFYHKIPAGNAELALEFEGILNNQMRGFYRSSYTHKGKQKHLATTQFESTDARKAFPCFDEPAHKAIFDVTLMVPKNLTAISNTLPTETLPHESGYKVVKFAPTPKMSTYLLAFIVGDFEFIEGKTERGVQVRVFVTPGKKHQAKFALEVAIKTLEFYEKYFGILYPLPILDMIAIPDFSSGAMENWGAVTYRETALLLDEKNSSASSKQWIASVIAHELAHQWFGNLVTMEWWTHLWLNEGFASYISYLAVDHLFPEWDMWTQFVVQDLNPALELDALKNTHPIEVEVGHPNEISQIFDQISYDKGASIIRMLAAYLGEDNFRKGLTHYLKKHSYSNAKTEDLWAAFEKVSGKPVKKMMHHWTKKPGYPLVKVIEGTKSLKLEQARFFSSPLSKKLKHDQTQWMIPLSYSDGKVKKQILFQKKTTEIKKLSHTTKFNTGETAVVRLDYPAQMLSSLGLLAKSKKINTLDRLGLIRDAFAMAESGNLPTTQALAFAENFQNETEYTIWTKLAGGIVEIHDLFASEGLERELKAYGLNIFEPIAERMGWKVAKEENHVNSLLRSLALYGAGRFGDKNVIEKAKSLFSDYINKAKPIHPDLRSVVYNLVAENGGAKEYSQLIKLYKAASMDEERERLGRSLGKFKQKEFLLKTLDFALSKEIKSQDVPFIVAGVSFNPNGSEIAWQYIKRNWKVISKRYAGSWHLLSRFISPLATLSEARLADDIDAFFKKHKAPGATRTIQQTLESIRSNAAWVQRDKKLLKNWFASQK